MIAMLLGALLAPSPTTIQVSVDGQLREALVYAPAHAVPAPVVFAFHGHGGGSRQASRSFGIQDAWPEAVVVYPQGLPTAVPLYDKQGRYAGWDVKPSDQNKDIRFFDALYPKVMRQFNGDSKRVFAMGHSNGGFFAYTLWSARPSVFAGIGSFEAACTFPRTLTPKPLFVSIGSQDERVPPRAQQRSLRAVMRAEDSAGQGTPYGPKGTLYPGAAPVVLWSYDGPHKFPADAVPTMVRFFQGLRSS